MTSIIFVLMIITALAVFLFGAFFVIYTRRIDQYLWANWTWPTYKKFRKVIAFYMPDMTEDELEERLQSPASRALRFWVTRLSGVFTAALGAFGLYAVIGTWINS